MKLYQSPAREIWEKIIQRPAFSKSTIATIVNPILDAVKSNGDEALRLYTEQFDKVLLDTFSVSLSEVELAREKVPQALKNSLQRAIESIKAFHASQMKEPAPCIETYPGVRCWSRTTPIRRVGLYVPGGSAPLISTVYMLGIPAVLAGVSEISLCTPPNSKGEIDPAILYTASEIGIKRIFKVGGAQAIAAMAYGTESIPKVDKIFGPGNQFVSAAKELVSQEGVAIDFKAGPSEVLVIADESSNPAWVAADLIAQAEHGADSQVVLLTISEQLAANIQNEIVRQISVLTRKDTINAALDQSFAVIFNSLDECIEFSNDYAPEHLILAVSEPSKLSQFVINAGSVFLGNYSPEVAGDYISGTNHCLPTSGGAKTQGGVKVADFQKEITFQEISKEGLQALIPDIANLAGAEGLLAHAAAASIRLKGERI